MGKAGRHMAKNSGDKDLANAFAGTQMFSYWM
jgi:hypothetical protein